MRSNAKPLFAHYRHSLLTAMDGLHWPLIGVMTLLSVFGFAMMYSAAGGALEPWALSQMAKFLIAFSIMLAIAFTPLNVLLRYAYVIYAICVLALIAVDVAGYVGKGAQRWVDVGVFNLQPSEIMKVALILALARYFHHTHPDNINRPLFIAPALLLVAVPAILILRQPNLGTTTILIGVSAVMFFAIGLYWRYFIGVALAGVAALPLAWNFLLHDYQKQRVLTFLDPTQDPLGAGYNILQSIIAIGSGGFFGKGYMQGSQGQLNFLPEKHTDFIFTMVAEEFGFVGSVAVLGAYGLILWYGIGIALRCRNVFGSMLAMGVVGLLTIHIFINVAMIMGLIPVVGVPLPLLSFGGSIMMSIMIGMGFLLNAHLHRDASVYRSVVSGIG